jgi:hypothetical protein
MRESYNLDDMLIILFVTHFCLIFLFVFFITDFIVLFFLSYCFLCYLLHNSYLLQN